MGRVCRRPGRPVPREVHRSSVCYHWTDEHERVLLRPFSVVRFGEAEARRLAIDARLQGQAESEPH